MKKTFKKKPMGPKPSPVQSTRQTLATTEGHNSLEVRVLTKHEAAILLSVLEISIKRLHDQCTYLTKKLLK